MGKLHIHWWHYLKSWNSQLYNWDYTFAETVTLYSWVCRCGDVKNVVQGNYEMPPNQYEINRGKNR